MILLKAVLLIALVFGVSGTYETMTDLHTQLDNVILTLQRKWIEIDHHSTLLKAIDAAASVEEIVRQANVSEVQYCYDIISKEGIKLELNEETLLIKNFGIVYGNAKRRMNKINSEAEVLTSYLSTVETMLNETVAAKSELDEYIENVSKIAKDIADHLEKSVNDGHKDIAVSRTIATSSKPSLNASASQFLSIFLFGAVAILLNSF